MWIVFVGTYLVDTAGGAEIEKLLETHFRFQIDVSRGLPFRWSLDSIVAVKVTACWWMTVETWWWKMKRKGVGKARTKNVRC